MEPVNSYLSVQHRSFYMVDTQACISRHPHPAVDLDKWQRTVDLMSELFDSTCGTIVQFRQDQFNAVAASNNPENFLERNSNWPWEMRSFCRKIMETGEGLYVNDAQSSQEWHTVEPVKDGPVRSYCGLPLLWPDGHLFGTICVIDTKKTDYDSTLIKLLEQFRDLINLDLQMIFNYEEIKSLALTDELTRIHNRRGFKHLAEQRVKDAKRFNQSISVIYIDIDNMKLINDEFGHQAGDNCLLAVSSLLSDTCRDSDIFARVGGDEFLVMLFTESENHTQEFCVRLEKEFQSVTKKNHNFAPAALSHGYSYRGKEHHPHLEDMISEADAHMYQRKKSRKESRAAT